MKPAFALALAGLLVLTVGVSPVAAQDTIDVKASNNARLSDGGYSVTIELKIRCPRGYRVLEALTYVVQQDNAGNYNGSNYGFFSPICDGRYHRYTETVDTYEDAPPFRRGKARISTYILLESTRTGQTIQASTSTMVHLK